MIGAIARRWARSAVVAGIVGTVWLATPSTESAASGDAAGLECVTGQTTLHFEMAGVPAGGFTGIRLLGLDSPECRGRDIRVEIRGNAAGDPARPATDKLLQLDSETDACTNALLSKAVAVDGGALELAACPPGTSAQAFDDATQVVVFVDGRQVAVVAPGTSVLGNKFVRHSSSGQEPDKLPFTGYWTAWMFWLGFGAAALGGLALMLGRRRRRG